jgi:hypothetical protein
MADGDSPFLAAPASEWLAANDSAFAIADGFPVSPRWRTHGRSRRGRPAMRGHQGSEQLVRADDRHVFHSRRLRVLLLEVFQHLRVLGIPP